MNKIIITWDGSQTNVAIKAHGPIPTNELIGVLEYAKLMLFEKREKEEITNYEND